MRDLRPLLLVFALVPSLAAAYDFQIDAQTVGQGYQLRAADDTLVNRRRLTQLLGLSVFNVGPRDVIGRPLDRNQFYLTLSLRFDADLGDWANVPQLSGRTPERELLQTKLEILYAFIGGRNLFGFLDVRLGRQLMVDLFDFLAFDGLALEARTPYNVAVEAWGGLAVTGAAPFDSPVYRVDGIALGGNPLGSLAARQEEALEPTFGVAVKSFGWRELSTRLSFMRTISFTGDRQPGEPSSGVIDEKLAWTARGWLWGGRFVPWAGVRYNVLAGRVDEVQAGARIRLTAAHALQAEYVLSAPTFDGDSIWNVFGAQAFNDLRLGYQLLLGRLNAYARAFVRLFSVEPTSETSAPPPSQLDTVDYGGAAGARLDWPRGGLRLDGYYEDGYGGLTGGVDLAGRMHILGDPLGGLGAEGRVSYVHFRDDARPIDHADSFGLQAGLRYTLVPGLVLHVLVEENVNRFYSSQLRVVGLLDLSFFVGPRGGGRPLARPGWM
jgi:hypothetical protein